MPETTAVIFDLDGTLIDSAPDIRLCLNAVLKEYGAAPLSLAQVHSFIGNGAPHLVKLALAATGLNADLHPKALAAFLALYNDAHVETVLYPHVLVTLEALKSQGHTLGLCTNKPAKPTEFVLETFGLGSFFDVVVAGDTLPQRKPDPAPLLHALNALEAKRAVYVGDSEVDAETARRAGLPFALFTEGYRKSPVDTLTFSRKFNDFRVLPAIVTELLA